MALVFWSHDSGDPPLPYPFSGEGFLSAACFDCFSGFVGWNGLGKVFATWRVRSDVVEDVNVELWMVENRRFGFANRACSERVWA